MSEDEFLEGAWIAAGPPPNRPRGPGCLGLLSVAALAGAVLASGFWAPLLAVGVLAGAWKLVTGTR